MTNIKITVSECEAVKRWNYEKNTELGYNPSKMGSTSVKYVWWTCSEGHDYFKRIKEQVKNTKCPTCNSLAFSFPELEAEWGANDKPFTCYTKATRTKVNWVCKKGHKYTQAISGRTLQGSGCPYCYGRYPTSTNNLATRRPQLVTIWSDKNKSPMESYLPASQKEAIWNCTTHGEYRQKIAYTAKASRTEGNKVCPYCLGYRVRYDTSLGHVFPELVKQWADENTKNIYEISTNNSFKALWECTEHGKYEQIVSSKVGGAGCPMCSGRQAHEKDNLGLSHPWLEDSWVTEVNGSIGDYKTKSNIGVEWRCLSGKGHSNFILPIVKRTDRIQGCPQCSSRITIPNKLIAARYQSHGSALEEGLSVEGGRVFVDVHIASIGVVVEFDSLYYHKDGLQRDTKKTKRLLDAGFTVVRIREEGLESLEIEDKNLYICSIPALKEYNRESTKEAIQTMLSFSDMVIGNASPLDVDKIIREVAING